MARVLSSRAAAVLARRLGAQPQPSVVLTRRHNHTRRRAAKVLEEDAAGSSAPAAADASAMSRRLEEAMDSAMVRLAELDWAPFRPGTSYFVPPDPPVRPCGFSLLSAMVAGSWAPRQHRGESSPSTRPTPSPPPPAGRFLDEVESPNMDANQAQEE